jgi:hypothetical protein
VGPLLQDQDTLPLVSANWVDGGAKAPRRSFLAFEMLPGNEDAEGHISESKTPPMLSHGHGDGQKCGMPKNAS